MFITVNFDGLKDSSSSSVVNEDLVRKVNLFFYAKLHSAFVKYENHTHYLRIFRQLSFTYIIILSILLLLQLFLVSIAILVNSIF